MSHSYEEIRNVVLDLLAGRETGNYHSNQFTGLLSNVAHVFEKREGTADSGLFSSDQLSQHDDDLFREVFWDLFREGVITLGCDSSNREFPFFQLARFGKQMLENEQVYYFHDASSYVTLIQENIPHINDVTLTYLQEAVKSFNAGCFLAATVMLGVAAEHTCDLLLEAAQENKNYGPQFRTAAKQKATAQVLSKFKAAFVKHVLPELSAEDQAGIDPSLAGILSVIKSFRDEVEHPSGKMLGREQVYVLLQLFVPYCKEAYRLMTLLK